MRLSRSSFVVVFALAGCPGTRTAGTPACPMDRTVVISSQEDVGRFAACTTASSLTIRTGATIDLAPLRGLESITGDLAIGPTVGMEEVAFAELREIRGTVKIASNGSLRGIFLPRLERAGRIEIEANASLTTIALPRLETTSGSILILENGVLELIDLSVLATVGKDLVIVDNPVLTLIEAGKLAQVVDLRVEGNRKLPPDQVDGIRAKTPPP
ncbi:MAG: hypothetical protein IPQ07_07675 [Myxococcales bacterium]|nr:hypothetical protein [Myxococcales bacterium]